MAAGSACTYCKMIKEFASRIFGFQVTRPTVRSYGPDLRRSLLSAVTIFSAVSAKRFRDKCVTFS